MVNKANVLRVADAIENAELVKRGIGFNMGTWRGPATGIFDRLADRTGHACGTVACIGGWAEIVLGLGPTDGCDYDGEVAVADAFGLGMGGAGELFYDWEGRRENLLSDITPAHAVAVLRHLAETGEVDWSVRPAKASDGGA